MAFAHIRLKFTSKKNSINERHEQSGLSVRLSLLKWNEIGRINEAEKKKKCQSDFFLNHPLIANGSDMCVSAFCSRHIQHINGNR